MASERPLPAPRLLQHYASLSFARDLTGTDISIFGNQRNLSNRNMAPPEDCYCLAIEERPWGGWSPEEQLLHKYKQDDELRQRGEVIPQSAPRRVISQAEAEYRLTIVEHQAISKTFLPKYAAS